MARTAQDTAVPEAPSEEPSRPPSGSRSVVIGWAGVLAAGAAAAALAVVTLSPDHDNQPLGRPLVDQRGTTRALEGSVEDSAGATGSGLACMWTSDIGARVVPAEDIGGPPTPESVLTFESCGGEWTGNMAWLNPSGPYARTWCTVTSNTVACAAGPTRPDEAPVEGASRGFAGHGSTRAIEGSVQDLCSLDRAGPTPAPPVDAVREPTGGDSGFVNPWAAGNAAVDRYLSELCRER